MFNMGMFNFFSEFFYVFGGSYPHTHIRIFVGYGYFKNNEESDQFNISVLPCFLFFCIFQYFFFLFLFPRNNVSPTFYLLSNAFGHGSET